jgi:hypothetical protein
MRRCIQENSNGVRRLRMCAGKAYELRRPHSQQMRKTEGARNGTECEASIKFRHYIQPKQDKTKISRIVKKKAQKKRESNKHPPPPLSKINNTHDHRNNHSKTNTPYPLRSATSHINPLILQLHSRHKLLQRALINIPIPAVLVKTLGASLRNLSISPKQRPTQHRAPYTIRPLRIQRSIPLRGALVAVRDERIALGDVVRGVEGADVGVVDVGRVGQVDDERGDVCSRGEVCGVAAEEGWAGVEAEVLEGGYGGDGGEAGCVLDVGEGAAVGCLEGGAGRGRMLVLFILKKSNDIIKA